MASKQRTGKKPAKRKRKVSRNEDVAKALSHPIRVKILSILNEKAASPNELSELLNQGLSKVSYHVKVLKEYRFIELVRAEPRRGAIEHFYRAIERAVLPEEVWKLVPQGTRTGIYGDVLKDIFSDIRDAVEGGTFDARDDFHLSWTPSVLGTVGWEAVAAELGKVLERIIEIQGEAASRLASQREEGFSATFAIIGFESPRSPSKSR